MVIFHSYANVFQRVYPVKSHSITIDHHGKYTDHLPIYSYSHEFLPHVLGGFMAAPQVPLQPAIFDGRDMLVDVINIEEIINKGFNTLW